MPQLQIGGTYALHSGVHNRFIRMNGNGNMDWSDPRGKNELPGDWTWERIRRALGALSGNFMFLPSCQTELRTRTIAKVVSRSAVSRWVHSNETLDPLLFNGTVLRSFSEIWAVVVAAVCAALQSVTHRQKYPTR